MASIPAPAWLNTPASAPPPPLQALRELGRGRSGVVYVSHESEGFPVARKVFASEGLTRVVQCLFLGSPNPYVWNEDAIRCAHLRREILAKLVERWFGDELYVAASRGWAWNSEARAFELRAQLVHGRAPELRHPLRPPRRDHAETLRREVLPKLQACLIESGFDGMVWQAGKGNPVAFNNFLLESDRDSLPARWAWIDLESGVPALAAIDPRAFFGFYLRRSLRLGRPLFDDVDVDRLRLYLRQHGLAPELLDRAEELAFRQRRWKAVPRFARNIGYREARGDISKDRADWFRARPLRWALSETARIVRRSPAAVAGRVQRLWSQLALIPWRSLPGSVAHFLSSQRHREDLARQLTTQRIDAWVNRQQMSPADAASLKTHLDREESATFATDFCVHLAIKPLVKGFEYWVCPLLYALGFMTEATLAFAIVFAGAFARSTYTGGRLVQNALRGKERPWTALAVGILPVVGNLAFPVQFLRSSRTHDDDLARFLLYDGLARIGARIPIWGGQDTLTEHALNRAADRFTRPRTLAGSGDKRTEMPSSS